MAMLSKREHAFGAPKYIINRYNVALAKFKVTLHVSEGNSIKVQRPLTYKEIVHKLTTVDQGVLFREGKVLNVEYRNTEFTADIEFVGFNHD